MPSVDNAQVPKPLTYTLMYHGLWAVLFSLTAVLYWVMFLATGQSLFKALVPPLGLMFFALVAATGAWLSYTTRLAVLLGKATWDDAFTLSSWSSWSVLIFAPLSLLVWQWAIIPISHQLGLQEDWGGVPGRLTEGAIIVEVIVWWLSHFLSVRGLVRGRRDYVIPVTSPSSIGVELASSQATTHS